MGKAALWVIALAAAPVLAARGDIIDLKDGRHLSGSMARDGDMMVIKVNDGTTVKVRPDQVERVTLTSDAAPHTTVVSSVELAAEAWKRTSQQIAAAGDLKTIIGLHKTFLADHPEAENTDAVKASLKRYEGLAAADAVRFHGEWTAKGEMNAKLKEWADKAAGAAELYRDGNMKDALDAAKTVLSEDAHNPDALKVAGLASYRVNDLRAARTYFTTVAAEDPGDLLAENNLAVISFAQKQAPEGLGHYVKAMKINPDNRLVLDNIVEATASYMATNDRNADVVKVLQRLYDIGEKKMETTLAAKGLTRYGSTWIDKPTADDLIGTQRSLQARIAKLQVQAQRLQVSAAEYDVQIKQAENDYSMTMNMILAEQGAAARGNNVAALQTAEQRAQTDLNRKSSLEGQKDAALKNLDEVMVQLGPLQQSLKDKMTPLLSGSQRMMEIGEDVVPPPPAPLPARKAAE